ncbi:THO complex subunit 6 homolog [Periophthalmus magnuspinnatus]|uniref:THO complex subunit 6 homolog n=1 Tax=Periophthalmus magnuspinnatus TaxID=409849 RepID=UPI00145A72B6|nr:THO complex subunit 6 homolog [Periophthalmus magnuspinnatus]
MGPVELLHMSVFSQSFSPCGRFLAAGNGYGEIALFSLSAALSPDSTPLSHKPVLTFTAHEGPVLALVSSESLLFSCGNGEIRVWSWSHLLKKNVKPLWTKRPDYKLGLEIPEINAMILLSKENSLVVGGGDNNLHVLDLETGDFKSVLRGHQDYIHCVCEQEREGQILSGSEDGAVRIWDLRSSQSVHIIEVHKYEACARPQYGKWISCLATDNDWMLCGGGPSLALWHLRSLSPTSVFPLSGCTRHAAFYQDLILAVGEGPLVSHCMLGGDVKAQIPSSSPNLNCLQINSKSSEHRMLTVGGSSDHIDVFTNLSYRAFSLSF